MAPDLVAEARLDRPQQIFVPFDLQLRMQSALHQNAGAAQVDGLLNLVEDHFLRMHVAFRMAHGPVEGAEAAIFRAEIRVVDVAIDDVADDAVRMQLAAHRVGRHADADQVVAVEIVDRFLPGHHTVTFRGSEWIRAAREYSRNSAMPSVLALAQFKDDVARQIFARQFGA